MKEDAEQFSGVWQSLEVTLHSVFNDIKPWENVFLAIWTEFGNQFLPSLLIIFYLLPQCLTFALWLCTLFLTNGRWGENWQLSLNWNGIVISVLCWWNVDAAVILGVQKWIFQTINSAFWFCLILRKWLSINFKCWKNDFYTSVWKAEIYLRLVKNI